MHLFDDGLHGGKPSKISYEMNSGQSDFLRTNSAEIVGSGEDNHARFEAGKAVMNAVLITRILEAAERKVTPSGFPRALERIPHQCLCSASIFAPNLWSTQFFSSLPE